MPSYVRLHKTTLLILFIILGVLWFFSYNFVSVSGIFPNSKNDLKIIEPKEESAYQDLQGNAVYLSKYKGEILIINSWASWSPYSKNEIDVLVELQEKYKKDITILAINRKESLATINAYLSAFKINSEKLVFLFDTTDHFYTASGGYAMPETMVYGKNGSIYLHSRGIFDRDVLEGVIQNLLK